MKAAMQSRSVEQSIEIAAPIEAVWKAMVEPEELTRWFPLEAGTNPDGTVWMGWHDQFRFSGRVEEIRPMRYMRSVPVFPPGFEPPVKMATEIWLESNGSKTIVRIVQSGFLADAQWDEEYTGTQRGWVFQLYGLKLYLEKHRGTPRQVAWARRMIAVPRAEAWGRVMSTSGLLREGRLDGLCADHAFSIRTVDGDRLEGTVHKYDAGEDFSALVTNWNNGLLRVQFDDLPMRGYRDAGLWLSTYGVPPADVQSLEQRWTRMLERLFPEPVPEKK